ncbi:MAG: translocation/assembly module TamB domain-containing protein [Terriglobales bacterium]
MAWTGAGAATLMVLIVIAIAALLHSKRFHVYLLRTAQEKSSAALGSQVQMKDFALHWSGISPTVDLYGIVVHGVAPYPDPPLLEADAIHAAVTITSLLHKAWYVSDIRIERPVARIFADKNGRTNLPAARSEGPGDQSYIRVFDLGIRHLLLERGEIYYNNRKSSISADVHDLSLQSAFEPLNRLYSGTLSYGDGHIQLQGANPIAHSFHATFTATPDEFRVENAVLSTANSRLSIAGNARNYSQPQVHATYEAVLDSGEFGRAFHSPSFPSGIVQSSGTVDWDSKESRPLLATVTANGEVRSAELTVSSQNEQVQIQGIGAHYSLANGNVAITGMHAQVLGGTLGATMTTRDLTGPARWHLSASVNDVSISELQRQLRKMAGPDLSNQIILGGTINGKVDASWGKTMEDLQGHGDATLQATAQAAQGGGITPINGVVRARYNGRSGQIFFDRSYLRTAQTSVSLNGTVGGSQSLQVSANSNDLHELETIVMALQTPGSEPIGIHGRATLSATVRGSTRDPRVTGQLTAQDLRVRGSAWKLLRANLAARPSQIEVENGELDSATHGRVTFNLTTSLQRWSFTKTSPFQLQFAASQLNAADLTRAAGSAAPIAGTLSADIVASGTQLAPAGHGTMNLASARVWGEPVRSANLRFQGTGKQLNANLMMDLPAGSATASVLYEPATQSYQAELHAPSIRLDRLQTAKARGLQLQGMLEVNASGRGSLSDPQLQAVMEIPQLQLPGQAIGGQAIRGVKLQANVANHVANINFDSEVLNTHAHGHGSIQLRGDYLSEASLDTQTISLGPWVAIYAPSQSENLSGETEVHATARGPLKDKTRIEAHLQIPKLAVNYKNSIQLAASEPIRADYANEVLTVQRSTIRGTGTELTFQASVPTAKDAPASLLVRGSVDLRLAQLVSPDITSTGELRFDIDSNGRRSDPNVQGQVRIVNASFATAGAPLGLHDGNGTLTLTRDRLNITQFKGNVGGGTVTASGGVVYRPQLQFDLAVAAQGVRILYDQDVRATVGSNLALTGSFDNALLTGQVGIDQVSFTSDFDIASLMSQFGGEETPPPTQGFSQNLNLDVGLQTPGGLNLTSRTLSLAGSANLRVRGTAAQPVLLGRLNLSSGDLIFSGNRYKLQGGTIDFSNRSRTEPVIDMAVNTTIDQYDVQLHFWGPADHLHTNYASDPALPPSDIINLIAFGKTSEAAATNPTPPGSLGAQSLIASQVSNQVTSRVEKLAGISQLSIDPVLGSSQQSPGARVAIQQRITSKIFVTFATDVTSTEREVIKLEYQANRKTSFNVVRDQNGGFSFETTFRKQW